MKTIHGIILCCCLFCLSAPSGLRAECGVEHWLRQTIYVPLYSHIYADRRFKDKPFELTATLSIRNTDPDMPLTLLAADFYDTGGNLLHSYVAEPQVIGPLASIRFIVQENELEGGSGAKFVIRWKADKPVVEPIVESIMIGTQMQQGISFISRGRVIRGDRENCQHR